MPHTVRDWMSRPVVVVDHDTSVSYAMTLMRRRRIHSVVVSAPNRVYGIVTTTDIRDKIVAEGRNPAETRVGDIMSGPLVMAKPTDAAANFRYAKEAERLTSNELNIWITARDTGSSLSEAPKPGGSGTTTFARCTTSQQAALLSARKDASSYSANAVSYLQSGLHGERYTTWFGSYDPQRYGTVTTHFNSIGNAMNNAPVKFDCGCKKKYYAYV